MKEELSDIISNGDVRAVQYPPERLLRATSIMKIDISPDLSSAKIFISVLGNSVEKRQVFVWLCENMGQIRYELCQRLRHMKRVPLIVFKLADTKEVADLVALIDEISTREVAEEEEELEFEEIELD
jgi:ribosome-binding factor A